MAQDTNLFLSVKHETNTSENPSHGSGNTIYQESIASVYLWKIIPPIIIFIGTVGNIFSIIILRRKTIRRTCCTTFLVVLAFSDLLVLYSGLLRHWISAVFGIDIRELGNFLCKIDTMAVYFFLDFSAWTQVAVTVERLCLVWFPQITRETCTKRFSYLSLTAVATCLLAINSHIAYGFEMQYEYPKNNTNQYVKRCMYKAEYKDFWLLKWPWIDLTKFCILPFIILCIGNMLIIIKVGLSKKAVNRQSSQSSNDSQKKNTFSSMNVTLFTLNTAFLLCNTPISLYLIGANAGINDLQGRDYAILQLMWPIVNFLMYLNNSINFLLYILSGSRFRREFRSLFRRRRHAIRHGRTLSEVRLNNGSQINGDHSRDDRTLSVF